MKRVTFIEMMGEPGSYDASVYDHFEDKDREGIWFARRFQHVPGVSLSRVNVCIGEKLPAANEVDGLVLAGSYNSVHDHTLWQKRMREWIPSMRTMRIPMLAICGSHQLLANMLGSDVSSVENGPYAGTFPVSLTDAGRASPLMTNIPDGADFQFANSEHVLSVPTNSVLLASSDRVPVAALDYGDHCYSTQFHPEGTHETLSTVWRHKSPEKMRHYQSESNGQRLVENFLNLVVGLRRA